MALRIPISRHADNPFPLISANQSPVERRFADMWKELKHKMFMGDRGIICEMSRIESQCQYPTEDPSSIKASDLFQRLNNKFCPEFRICELGPVDGPFITQDYLELQNMRNQWADRDLDLIWNKPGDGLLAQLTAHGAFKYSPAPKTIFDIKGWLAHRQNACHLREITHLNLSHLGIKTLPEEIFKLNALKRIQLEGNRFTTFPYYLGAFSQLREYDPIGNPLQGFHGSPSRCIQTEALPFEGGLPKLEALVMCNLNPGQVLGIRVAASRDTSNAWQRIYEFLWTGTGWAGEILLGHEFRFVCIDHFEKRIFEEKSKVNRVLSIDLAERRGAIFQSGDVRF